MTRAAAYAIALTLVAAPASASSLLAPSVGPADNATMGTRIGDPHDPAAAMFENPAGLVAFEKTTINVGVGIAFGTNDVEASAPSGYNESDQPLAMLPSFGLSVVHNERWRFGTGVFGAQGSTFNFDSAPALGVGRFFSETSIGNVPLAVAYRVSDRLWVGAEAAVLFGQLRMQFTLGGLDFRYKLNGPGVQGMFGASFRPSETWMLGLGVRTPGIIWMDGSMPVPEAGRQNVKVDLKMPTQVMFGVTRYVGKTLALSSSVRFTDASTFGDSTITYDITTEADNGFVPHSRDEWKVAFGADWAFTEALDLRAGVGWSSHIVGSQGVNPLVWDSDDIKISLGGGYSIGSWTFDFAGGYMFADERRVGADTALILPGQYRQSGGVVMFGLVYSL